MASVGSGSIDSRGGGLILFEFGLNFFVGADF